MNDQVVCPKCKHVIPISEAFTHEIREQYRAQAIEYVKKKDAEYRKKLEDERGKLQKELEESTKIKIEKEMKLAVEDSKNENEELKKQNTDLQKQLLEVTKSIRELKAQNDQKTLDLEKKLNEEQERLRTEEKKRFDEEYRLKMSENEKKLSDALKVNDELKRKLEQGSQQTQGEVLELELEKILTSTFPLDTIQPVAKGIRGGDIIHSVKNSSGKICGTVIWETKRTRTWSNEWIPKLKEDQRALKAEVAILISEALPADMKSFGFKDGVWIGNFSCIMGLAHAIRRNLLELTLLKTSQEGKQEKMEVLYQYIYGTEFRQRIEAIMESFTSLQNNMEREKRWFAAKWAKEEKDIRKVLDNTLGMIGDLEGITGKELNGAKKLDLLSDGEENEDSQLL